MLSIFKKTWVWGFILLGGALIIIQTLVPTGAPNGARDWSTVTIAIVLIVSAVVVFVGLAVQWADKNLK